MPRYKLLKWDCVRHHPTPQLQRIHVITLNLNLSEREPDTRKKTCCVSVTPFSFSLSFLNLARFDSSSSESERVWISCWRCDALLHPKRRVNPIPPPSPPISSAPVITNFTLSFHNSHSLSSRNNSNHHYLKLRFWCFVFLLS